MSSIDEARLPATNLEFLKLGTKDHVAIICHDQPDPDCIASALAMQSIANHFGLSASIYYGGELGHTQNRVMVNVLNISTHKLDAAEADEETRRSTCEIMDRSYIVLVDVSNFGKQPCEAISSFVSKDREPDIVIDHHDLNPKLSCLYIRKPFGSCSTIMYELLREHQVPISKMLATALYLGISTDTSNLQAEGVVNEDREVFEELKSLIDPESYERILNYPRSTAILDMRRRVYNTIETSSSLAVANAGIISTNQRSLIAELCDELLQVETIETAVVMAIVDEGLKGEKYLVASFRSGVLALNMQDFISKTFGKKFGGGRKGAGGARIPIEPMLKSVLDDMRSRGDDSEFEKFTQPIFRAFAERVKSENSNI